MSKLINAKVKSSQIEELDYNGETEELVATFKGGTSYLYSGVPVDVYMKVVIAESVGKEFNTTIKAGGYEFTKLEQPKVDEAKERAIEEEQQLTDKITKLVDFIESDKFSKMSQETQDLLTVQYDHMLGYNSALQKRIFMWK